MANEVEKNQVTNFNPIASKPVFSWQSPEFIRYEKNWKWFLTIFGIAAFFAGIFYWQKQLSGAAMVVVAAVVLAILSEMKPKNVKCAIYREGVVVDDKVYTFGQFKSFAVGGRDLPKMRFQLAGRFAGQVVMPMQGQNVEQIILFVSKFLPETNEGGDLVDTINSIFRF